MPHLQASQNLTVSRRKLLAAGLTGLCLAPLPQLQKLSPLPDVPPPKFWFGDRVIWRWWTEDPNDRNYEIEIIEIGTVIGLARGQDQYYWDAAYKCWWYFVKSDSESDQVLSEQMIVEKELEFEGNGSC